MDHLLGTLPTRCSAPAAYPVAGAILLAAGVTSRRKSNRVQQPMAPGLVKPMNPRRYGGYHEDED